MENVIDLVLWARESIQWLKKVDCGCCTYKLDDRLAICIGWSGGYEDGYRINIGLKVWTSDDMLTDYDWLAYAYDEEQVWDNGIEPSNDLKSDIEYLLKEYEELKQYDIDEKGYIFGKKEEEVEE